MRPANIPPSHQRSVTRERGIKVQRGWPRGIWTLGNFIAEFATEHGLALHPLPGGSRSR